MTNFSLVPSWEITQYDQDGDPVALFDSMESFSIQKKLNDFGTYVITFIDDGDERLASSDYWQLDGLTKFVRDLPYYVGELGETYNASIEFQGLFRRRVASLSSDGEKDIKFEGVSLEHLLSRRVIAANEGTVRADKNDRAETVLREYVAENCGYGATPELGRYFYADYGDPTTRVDAYGVMPRFSIAPLYPVLAPYWAGSKSMDNLLDAVKEIGKAKQVDFNIDYDETSKEFIFQVFSTLSGVPGIGSNRSFDEVNPYTGLNKYGFKPVLFSIKNDNVQDITLDYDRMKESNFVFVLGQGEMSTRSVYVAENIEDTDDSPWNQIEIARSASDNEYVYQLKDTANVALSEGAYIEKIEFTPFQTPSCFYGYHYFLGDIVSVSFDYALESYRIVGLTIEYNSEGETIQLELESPTRQVEGTTPNRS